VNGFLQQTTADAGIDLPAVDYYYCAWSERPFTIGQATWMINLPIM
jgi:hypothetical protein